MRRGLAPFEVIAVLVAAALAPHLGDVPIVLPLLVVASAARWAAGGSLLSPRAEPGDRMPRVAWYAGIAALAGFAALGLALVVGAPVAEGLTERAVVWTAFPVVRGNPGVLSGAAVIVAATAIASELVLRGWIVERVLELGGPPLPAILVGAFAEALLAGGLAGSPAGGIGSGLGSGGLDARLGAAIFGVGLGWMYVGAGRRAVVPACARLAFALGALALEAARLVG